MKRLKTYLLILAVIFNIFLFLGTTKVSAEEKWYFLDTENKVQGPYTTKELCEGVLKNSNAKTLCYKEGETPVTINAEQNKPSDNNTYNLLAPLPGLKSIETNDIGKYFNIVFNIAIGICGVLAVIMLVIHGISYMTSESFTEKAELKKKIWGPIGGLLLALGSYAILNTIDPALTGKEGLSVDQVSADINPIITLSEGQQIRLTETQQVVGTKKFKRTKYYNQIKEIAARPEYNIPHCLLQAAIQRESGGIAGLVGHDEDAASSGIKSRREFIASGKKYDGTTFTPDNSLIEKGSFKNTEHAQGNPFSALNPNAKDLGLDWRFSHGIGLFGVTLYPKGSSYGDYTVGIQTTIPGYQRIFAKDLYDPTVDIILGSYIMANNYKKCGKNIEQTYRAYGSGNCTGGGKFMNTEAPIRTDLYNQCVAQDK